MQALTFLPSWAWICISAIFFACGEFLSKKFALNPGWTVFALFIIVDLISATTWIPAIFEKNQLSITGVIWSIVSLMATVLVGILIFDEKLTIIQAIGLFVGLISVIMLSL
jgi:multidrug transporter EmrE-like cation transporter